MKIVADENMPLVEALFSPYGEVVRLPGRTMTAEQLRDADVLLVRSVTNVNEALLTGTKVKFVGSATIGVDHVDQAYLQSSGISMANAPGCNAVSVVNYVFAALCQLDVNWQGKQVGIIGCGNVGGALYRQLKSLGVDCRCYDPFLTNAENTDLTSLDEVLASDIVSMHTPLTRNGDHPTYHMLSASQLQKLKAGAVLINAGRGAAINNADLLQLLEHRTDLRVVLDVWENEPDVHLPLMDKVELATPHIAGYSRQGKINGTSMVRDAFLRWQGLAIPESKGSESFSSLSASSVPQAISSAYDIAADNQRMRTALAESDKPAEAFDRLRKNYPERNEFSCYQVSGELTESEISQLELLGFSV